MPGADAIIPSNTARDASRISPQELQSPGMLTSHSHPCARGAATMRTALTRHIPLVLIEMRGSGKIVISGEILTSPDICDSKSNHFLFFPPKSEISMHFRLKTLSKEEKDREVACEVKEEKNDSSDFQWVELPSGNISHFSLTR